MKTQAPWGGRRTRLQATGAAADDTELRRMNVIVIGTTGRGDSVPSSQQPGRQS